MRRLFALFLALPAYLLVADATTAGTSDKGLPGAPKITSVTALPMGWKVEFNPPADSGGSPIINYAAVDPNQHWFSSHAGSAHILTQSPVFVQGYSGAGRSTSASFQVYAQNANGWGPPSSASRTVSISGDLPAFTDPYWIYHGGTYYWSGDFSYDGGDTTRIPPPWGSSGPGNPHDVATDWFDTSVPGVNGSANIRITHPVAGNFSPAIPGTTIDLVAHPYAYWTICIYPSYDGADYTIKFETTNDLVVTKVVTLSAFVTSPRSGTFTPHAWNHVNVPMRELALTGRTIYKQVIEQANGTSGTWRVDNLGFANKPQ